VCQYNSIAEKRNQENYVDKKIEKILKKVLTNRRKRGIIIKSQQMGH
jgi:hypothetical protein